MKEILENIGFGLIIIGGIFLFPTVGIVLIALFFKWQIFILNLLF